MRKGAHRRGVGKESRKYRAHLQAASSECCPARCYLCVKVQEAPAQWVVLCLPVFSLQLAPQSP